jgi:hypothetical protein
LQDKIVETYSETIEKALKHKPAVQEGLAKHIENWNPMCHEEPQKGFACMNSRRTLPNS